MLADELVNCTRASRGTRAMPRTFDRGEAFPRAALRREGVGVAALGTRTRSAHKEITGMNLHKQTIHE